MRTQSKIFDEAVYTALKGTEPDVAISTTNIEIGAKGGGGLRQLAEGSTENRHSIKDMSDQELAEKVAYEDIIRSINPETRQYTIPSEDLNKAGLVRIRTNIEAIDEGKEFDKRKSESKNPKTAHIRKLYYLSLNRLLNEIKQNTDRTKTSPSYESMQRLIDKGIAETFPEGYAEPIAPEYMGEYKMRLEPGDTQDFKDAYSGGGYPGPSFIPNKEQTAPVFESSSFEEIKDQIQSKKGGGGLSNLNETLMIKGQPHKLAWIRPDEASALKAMGGSGKKVGGIPAYFDEWSWAESADVFSDAVQPDGSIPDADTRAYDDAESSAYKQLLADKPTVGATTYYDGKTVDDDTPTDMRKGFFGLFGDQMTRGEVLDKAKSLGYTTWRNTVGKYSHDPSKDYDAWFDAQDPSSLMAGFRVGDPVGYAMKQSFNIINTQLGNKFKRAREEMESISGEKELSEGTIKNLAEEAGVKDFQSYSGIDYPWYMPGGMIAQGLNLLSRTVAGTGTVNGVGVHVHKDGTVTPVSPEDSPGFDHEAMKGENIEALDISEQRGGFGFTLKDVEQLQENPLTGMKGLLAKPSTRKESNTFLSNLLDTIYGQDQGQRMIG